MWSPDGRTLAFISAGGEDSTTHARTIRSDGSSAGRSELLLRRQRPVWEVQFGPGEGQFVFREGNAAAGSGDDGDIGLVTFDADTTVTELLATAFNERTPALSPDGRWLAYVSDISGRDEVYVRPFPEVLDGRSQVSTDGGAEPRWGHGGDLIFYREIRPSFVASPSGSPSGPMVAVTYTADSTFQVRSRERLFDAGRYRFGIPGEARSHWPSYDVARDDQRFLMIRTDLTTGEGAGPRLVYVRNLAEELEEAGRGG